MQILGNQGIYFLTVLLPPELERQILAFKQHFAGIYASRMALLPPGHITLVETFSLLESDLKRALNAFSINNPLKCSRSG